MIIKDLTKDSKYWCPFTHVNVGVNPDCYSANPRVKSVLDWATKYVQCARFLDADRYAVNQMSEVLQRLASPAQIDEHRDFRRLVNEVHSFVLFIEANVMTKLNRMSREECTRLDEAIVCFQNYCFIASVAMAVSAVEHRLIELIKKKHEQLYRREFNRSTLGQLIQVFDDDQYRARKYTKIKTLPAKHKPLLLLLNQYRIFSVHPKGESVTPQVAESILHLCFTFVSDESTSPYTPEELKCADIE